MAVCAKCGFSNRPEDRFCMGCGQTLVGQTAGPAAPNPVAAGKTPSFDDLIEAGIVCPACETYNEVKNRACTRCGRTLTGLTGYLQAVTVAPLPTPGSPTAPVQTPVAPEAVEVDMEFSASDISATETPKVAEAPAPPAAGILGVNQRIALRIVRGPMAVEAPFQVPESGVMIGRVAESPVLSKDECLSVQHFAIQVQDGVWTLSDLQSKNGTFLRVRQETLWPAGTEFLVGQQRLVLLGVGGPTTDVRIPPNPDSRPYGSPFAEKLFAAFKPLHASPDGSALAGAVWLHAGPVISVGKSGCHYQAEQDPWLAPKHAEFHLEVHGVRVQDGPGSSGVFTRLKSSAALKHGDEIHAGQMVFRVEASA